MWGKDQQFYSVFPLDIGKHVLFAYLFIELFRFQWDCFKFYWIIIHCRAHVFGALYQCLFWPSSLLVALNLARNKAWVAPGTLFSLLWCLRVFLTFLVDFCFNLYIGNLLLFYRELLFYGTYWEPVQTSGMNFFCRNK